MKAIYVIFFFCVFSIAFNRCVTEQKVAYNIPDHVTTRNKELLTIKCDKGKILYKLHCADCHGIFSKGKDSIPNFSKIQIDNYHTAALIGMDPKNHAVARKMSSEQIDQIVTFLMLRIPNKKK